MGSPGGALHLGTSIYNYDTCNGTLYMKDDIFFYSVICLIFLYAGNQEKL